MDNEKKKKINNSKKNNNKSTQKKGNRNNKINASQLKNKGENAKQENNKKDNNIKNKKEEKVINEIIEKKEIEIKEEKKEEKKEEILETKKESLNNTIIEEKTNKTGLIVLLAILIIIVGICIFYQVDNKNNANSTPASAEESSEIMDNFYKYFNSKKTKIIFYASSTCGYCKLETPIMEQIDKDYEIDYLHIDASKLTKNDREKMLKELGIEHATPTTVIVKDGKVIDTKVGYVDGGEMIEFLKENQILDKDAVYTPEQYITFINYDEFNNLLKEDGKHVITIGQTGCSHCIATKPVLNAIAKEFNIKIYYLNISEMTQSENSSFINALEEIGYDEKEFVASGQYGTPLTLVVENGKVIYYINGEKPTKEFKNELKKAKVISE